MTNHTDNAIDGAELDLSGEKATRGPRPKYFICINWKSKQWGPVAANTADEARDIWGAEHLNAQGEPVSPNVVCGGDMLKDVGGGSGYYLAKGTGMGDAQRISVTVSARHMSNFTSTRLKAEFKGWIVYCNGIKGFKDEEAVYADDDLMMVTFDQPVDPNQKPKPKKPKLKKTEAVRKADLRILTD
jgi:hypothetical protein